MYVQELKDLITAIVGRRPHLLSFGVVVLLSYGTLDYLQVLSGPFYEMREVEFLYIANAYLTFLW